MNKVKIQSKINIEDKLMGDKSSAIDALMYACFYIDDADWIQKQCLDILNRDVDKEVKNLAITCLGHVARIHTKINKEKVLPVLRKLLSDPEFSGAAGDALDDIDIFTRI